MRNILLCIKRLLGVHCCNFREADGERKLSLLALRAFEGGAATGAECLNGVGFFPADQGDDAHGECVVQVPARCVAAWTGWDPPVTFR
ncbi:hypothetical protein K1719_002463 [Acacia pycnantha]|nr:hypothetical protein K1719_002463 [Acacia pycnantha]